MKREVTRVITPGTVTDTNILLRARTTSCFRSTTESQLGCAFLDISTGEFAFRSSPVTSDGSNCCSISNIFSAEVLFPERMKESINALNGIAKTSMEDWLFDVDYASRVLREQLGTATLDGFGLKGKPGHRRVGRHDSLRQADAESHARTHNGIELPRVRELSGSRCGDNPESRTARIVGWRFERHTPRRHQPDDHSMGSRLFRNWLFVLPSMHRRSSLVSMRCEEVARPCFWRETRIV